MKTKNIDIKNLKACVYGMAIGDALGVPYEFMKRGTFTCTDMRGGGTWNQPKGTYSDDTGMALAMLDSIADCGRLDTDDMLERFRDWWLDGRYMPDGVCFDIGNTVRNALSCGTGMGGEFDNGNGSLMRTAPLALLGCTDHEVMEASAITHAHETSMLTCLRFVRILERVVSDRYEIIDEIHQLVGGYEEHEIESNAFVSNTFRAALWCFDNTDSYEECVLKAVNLGKDTDTTACVAGALAGLTYGFEQIPSDWVNALRGKEIIDGVIGKFQK